MKTHIINKMKTPTDIKINFGNCDYLGIGDFCEHPDAEPDEKCVSFKDCRFRNKAKGKKK